MEDKKEDKQNPNFAKAKLKQKFTEHSLSAHGVFSECLRLIVWLSLLNGLCLVLIWFNPVRVPVWVSGSDNLAGALVSVTETSARTCEHMFNTCDTRLSRVKGYLDTLDTLSNRLSKHPYGLSYEEGKLCITHNSIFDFMKGKREKTGGRQKGSQNKTTISARQLFFSIMEGQQVKIKPSLDAIRKKDPAKYLDVLARLFPYFMPKKLEIDTPTHITINVKRRLVKQDRDLKYGDIELNKT